MKHTKSVAFTTESGRKCRCCTFPSTKFLELDSISKTCGIKRTYKDILYEIANIKVFDAQEKFLTQKVCQKCSTQLNNCYKFILQARKAYEQHLSTINDLSTENDAKDFGDIPELLREVPLDLIPLKKSLLQMKDSAIEKNSGSIMEIEIKTEPILLECTPDADVLMNEDKLQVKEIKEEKPELLEENSGAKLNEKDKALPLTKQQEQKDLTNDPTYEEEIENFDNFNTDSENDDKDEENSMNEDDFDKDLSKAPIAVSCEFCHKIYRDKKALKTHKHYTHMPDDKKRPCPLCSFKSSRLSNLKVHVGVVHGADKVKEIFKPPDVNSGKFSCSICKQSFSRKDTLQRHIKTIHENPQRKERQKPKTPKKQERFLCTYCGGVFRSKCGLVRHVVIHTGERPFPCEICQKTFKRPEDLHMHRIIHSDEKPHQCLQCGKAFKRSDKLKVHMRVHSESRPYKCNECEKTFKYPNVLSTHMLIHTGQNPFQCKTCGESFSLRSSFNNHCLVKGHL
ncbi:hypothetical protein DOY81_002835 [Sarcophaga bullata]|nr:hypothetical protein DOY81_002835 [Sarcophaga bullata]